MPLRKPQQSLLRKNRQMPELQNNLNRHQRLSPLLRLNPLLHLNPQMGLVSTLSACQLLLDGSVLLVS
ncbi:hypothetical protein MT325_m259R [Paramecium bursaria chlorella virus MT325]|uniref:Uncharacterized protein m259R n=1 Tax=Paramecium bursaria Chlorella virus MT325 TaxID=346932 RepID=A7ITY9_PBCVM|nr:hypothetical protein MT325_m259R [Paramecium bursaria chlorella virus MT325]